VPGAHTPARTSRRALPACPPSIVYFAAIATLPCPPRFSYAVIPGTLFSGSSPDQSKSVTVVMFTQGKAFTTLEFDGAPNPKNTGVVGLCTW
jgi:hypothetical protein